ncbi:MAG TPA: hypothetical protein VIG30_15855 [Ktedonobacterales bacterium]|jgi:hypothetical protein
MGDEWTGKHPDASNPRDAANADDLERQAREAIAQIRERVGEFGGRVRRVIERAGSHWEASAAVPDGGQLPVAAGELARTLARRWADIDFLVDPELAAGLTVQALDVGAIWRAEVRERGETRTLDERIDSYRGTQAPDDQPALPVWDYNFPLTPEIESGERRERVPGAGGVQACERCGGTGQRDCAACAGAGTEVCPRCQGRGQLTCARCRGSGRIAASNGERPLLQDAAHLHLHAERLLHEASERVSFLRDRLQNSGQPVQSARPLPVAGDAATIPCPDCDHGQVACDCDHGRRACAICGGSGQAECARCKGSGRVVRHREVVRRFDTRIGRRALPSEDPAASWVPEDVLARGAVEPVWEGPLDSAPHAPRPETVPAQTWNAALAFAAIHHEATAPSDGTADARRVIARRLALVRLPLTRIAYTYADKPYVFVAFGREGAERFWAERFPHRWSRVGRFLRAIARDLGEPAAGSQPPPGRVSSLADYRARRDATLPDPAAPPEYDGER